MVAEENHSIGFDDKELTMELTQLASKMDANNQEDPSK